MMIKPGVHVLPIGGAAGAVQLKAIYTDVQGIWYTASGVAMTAPPTYAQGVLYAPFTKVITAKGNLITVTIDIQVTQGGASGNTFVALFANQFLIRFSMEQVPGNNMRLFSFTGYFGATPGVNYTIETRVGHDLGTQVAINGQTFQTLNLESALIIKDYQI